MEPSAAPVALAGALLLFSNTGVKAKVDYILDQSFSPPAGALSAFAE
mgnify:CR=1 FL=1